MSQWPSKLVSVSEGFVAFWVCYVRQGVVWLDRSSQCSTEQNTATHCLSCHSCAPCLVCDERQQAHTFALSATE